MPGATASDNRVFVVGGFSGRAYYRNFLTLNQYADLLITAQVDIDPDTLNLRSQGQWITAYIELPLGYDPRNIELASVRIRGTIPAIADPRYSFVTDPNVYLTDKDGDGILERMVKFDRGAVQAGLSPGSVELVVTGKVAGLNFQGSDTIRVIE